MGDPLSPSDCRQLIRARQHIGNPELARRLIHSSAMRKQFPARGVLGCQSELNVAAGRGGNASTDCEDACRGHLEIDPRDVRAWQCFHLGRARRIRRSPVKLRRIGQRRRVHRGTAADEGVRQRQRLVAARLNVILAARKTGNPVLPLIVGLRKAGLLEGPVRSHVVKPRPGDAAVRHRSPLFIDDAPAHRPAGGERQANVLLLLFGRQ